MICAPGVQVDPHAWFVGNLGPAPDSPLGHKPADLRSRRTEAGRLSELLAAQPGFSFVRLGDMELTQMLAAQCGIAAGAPRAREVINGTTPYGNPGTSPGFATRLRRAYETASYVDFHERLWPISELLPKLELNSIEGQHRNPDTETSYILLTWLEFEFRTYCEGRRAGFTGAEAGLLENLLGRAGFREAASGFWPRQAHLVFQPVRRDGKHIEADLELIKQDIASMVREHSLDTVFLSLGGAAKPLCVELAAELGVRMVDAGSMLRLLTYSGSDGNRASRSTHFPFLYRVSFATWCDAMEATWPSLAPHELLAKVHAQLILEVQKKEVGWTHASKELDLSEENRAAFAEAHQIYLARYRRLFDMSAETKRERAHFLHFCGTHELTQEGRRFLRWFKAKSFASRLWRRNRQ
jgi:hypothetical protein